MKQSWHSLGEESRLTVRIAWWFFPLSVFRYPMLLAVASPWACPFQRPTSDSSVSFHSYYGGFDYYRGFDHYVIAVSSKIRHSSLHCHPGCLVRSDGKIKKSHTLAAFLQLAESGYR